MQKIVISEQVAGKISDLEFHLTDQYKVSREAALRRCKRMRDFIGSFSSKVAYPICRFKKWQQLGYRCAVFERNWVFAYEVFDDGIIVRDMSHTSLLII